ncbi:MAG: FeoA family protein, partial [Dermabacter sp.]|nr:FeoA family protein [Dermabacter sp.]
PHGDPIPCDIHDAPDPGVPLTRCERGESVVISRVSDDNPDILRYCAKRTLAPGTRITILEEMDSTGLMSIEGGGQRIELSAQIANAIRAVPEAA